MPPKAPILNGLYTFVPRTVTPFMASLPPPTSCLALAARNTGLTLFFFAALASVVNIEPVVGAFIGGMLFALVFAGRDAVLEKLGGVGYGFFIPIFFISVGMKFSFSDLVQISTVKIAFLITGVIFLLRIVAGAVLLFSSIKKQKIVLIALGLSFPLTMLVAVASICYETEIISKSQSSSILLAAMITAILYPWLFKAAFVVILPDSTVQNSKQ